MTHIVYDTGALIAAERSDRLLWALHRAALRNGHTPLVPAGVVGQAWRGGPQPNLSRLLRGAETLTLTDESARAAGRLCGRAGTSDIVDASVVVAAQHAAVVVTSGPDDVAELAQAAGAELRIHRV